MKHWDGRDRDEQPYAAMPPAWRNGCSELRISRQDRQRLAQFFDAPAPPRRRQPPHVGSVIGLVLAVGVLVGVAWLLAPGSPVSSKILH